MRTIRVPFQFNNLGRIDVSYTAAEALGHYLTNLLVTDHFERVFLPQYGANLTGFLFSPMLNVLMGSKADEAKRYLSTNIPYGEVVDVSMLPSHEESTVDVRVRFRVGPGGDVLSLAKRFTGVVTEESDL